MRPGAALTEMGECCRPALEDRAAGEAVRRSPVVKSAAVNGVYLG